MNKKTVKCPICEKQTDIGPSNAYRPFCSERCRLIDLGQWFEESYTVSEPIDINDDLSDIERKH